LEGQQLIGFELHGRNSIIWIEFCMNLLPLVENNNAQTVENYSQKSKIYSKSHNRSKIAPNVSASWVSAMNARTGRMARFRSEGDETASQTPWYKTLVGPRPQTMTGTTSTKEDVP
jgi:hypothetical protein